MADEVARWATGTPGIAATRLLFVSGGRVYRMDSDGEAITPLTPAGQTALSPAWSPDGQRFAYTQLGGGRGGVLVQTLASGAALQVPGTADGAQHHARVLAGRPARWRTRTRTRPAPTFSSRTSPIAAARNA